MKRINLTLFVFLFTSALLFSKEFRLGVIYDNDDYKEVMNKTLLEELEKNFGEKGYHPVILREETASSSEAFDLSLNSMEKDSEIDAILTMGVLGSEMTLQRKKGYSKLIVAPFGVSDPGKGRTNLSYISEKVDVPGDIKLIEETVKVKNISFLIPNYFYEGYLRTQIDLIGEELKSEGYNLKVILANEERKEVSSKLDETDLLYILEANYDDVADIIDQASEKKIPSFARISMGKLTENVLMSYDITTEINRRIRATAINIARSIELDSLEELSTILGAGEKSINFNMTVAEKLDIHPSLVFIQKVNLINMDSNKENTLKFKEGINFAISSNPEIQSRKEDITGDEYGYKSAKSKKKPQLDAFADYERLDKNTAKSPTTSAENSVRGGVSLSYLLYDENVNANVTIKELEKESTEARYQQESLDTILKFTESYLTVLELNARLEVERYNYKLMKEYLQIAKTKFQVGTAGPEDIYRFQSEIADALTGIVEIEGQIKVAEANLNRVLNRPMSSEYTLEDITSDSNAFIEIIKVIDDSRNDLDGLKEFFIHEGVVNSPEIKQIELAIKAKERELLAAKRERYMPKVNAFGEWSDDLRDDWGEGSDLTNKEDRWNLGARVEIPLYKGGDIEYSKQRIRSELKSLKHQKDGIESEVGKSVSSAFADTIKDYVQITTTKESAEAAKKNLDLIGNFYAQGTISISDLLDARTASISTEQIMIAARYSLLKSVFKLERSSGEYFIMMDDIAKESKLRKLKSYTTRK